MVHYIIVIPETGKVPFCFDTCQQPLRKDLWKDLWKDPWKDRREAEMGVDRLRGE